MDVLREHSHRGDDVEFDGNEHADCDAVQIAIEEDEEQLTDFYMSTL